MSLKTHYNAVLRVRRQTNATCHYNTATQESKEKILLLEVVVHIHLNAKKNAVWYFNNEIFMYFFFV